MGNKEKKKIFRLDVILKLIEFVQVLERCHVILMEIPANLRQRRAGHVVDSLHHMVACLTYHMAKVDDP